MAKPDEKWTEAARERRGSVQVKLRLSVAHRRLLEALADESGYTMSEMVETLLDNERAPA